ncbi:MAG: hypothetical protein HY550_10015 [Elusimicrobia bacterium]|nr:hypothetical protein [Elusimicrobiota bacterium]
MKASIKLLLAAALLLPAVGATAREAAVIDEASLMIIPAEPGAAALLRPSASGDGPLDQLKDIVNLAMKIYKIIMKNRPVVNIETDYSNAVPAAATHWTQLTGWQGPESKLYTFKADNVGGLPAVTAAYKVHYVWGGSFRGKGKYLTGVTIEPVSITTAWGCKLDVDADVPDASIVNVGSAEAPLAQMDVRINWHLKTFTQHIEHESVYRVRGDGALQEMGVLFSRGREALKLEAAERAVKSSGLYAEVAK